MEALFWIALIGCAYSYAIYPALLSLLSARSASSGAAARSAAPRVSLIIACRNEARRLRHKLDNALALDYSNLEILVASDASSDESDSIVQDYADRGVKLVRSPARSGKEHAQGLAVAAASGEIIVFSDAGTDLPPESIRFIVEDFSDPAVGAVSSEDTFVSTDGKLVGEGAYVRYEMWLRRLESQRAGLVGLSGSFFAVRRSVLTVWDDSVPSDFSCALHTVRARAVAISDARVRGIYRDIADPSREYGRKLRTVVRGMAALAKVPEVLNPFRYGLFAFQMWGHKLMRWLVPWFMGLLLIASLLLAMRSTFYAVVLALQIFGYAILALAHVVPALRKPMPVRLFYFFVQANLAIAHAGFQFLRGHRIVTWEPSAR